MGERAEHAPGTFSWVDLSTSDQEGAKTFYSGLFGWQADDRPVGEGVYYSMQQLRGRDVAAISPQPQQQRDAGVPPLWNSYITVSSADEAAERASSLRATVHAPPFDVMDAGRMAVIQDPQGAFFMVWEPRNNIGAGLVNAPGAFCWNELFTPDVDASVSFYRDLFGWTFEPFETSAEGCYIVNDGGQNGGIRPLGDPGMPPGWLVYFAVEDVEASLSRAESLGGSRVAGPLDLGPSKVGVARDPQGATFALYAGYLDP
jgi:uncharacterized protein